MSQALDAGPTINFADACLIRSVPQSIHDFFFSEKYPHVWDAVEPTSAFYNSVDAIFDRQLMDLHYGFIHLAPTGFRKIQLDSHPADLPLVQRVTSPRTLDDDAARMGEKASHIFRYNGI